MADPTPTPVPASPTPTPTPVPASQAPPPTPTPVPASQAPPPTPTPVPACSPDTLEAAGKDADAGAGQEDVGDAGASCPGGTPLPVTPIITINNPIVLVKRSYTNPKRQPVVLQTDDATFDGSGTLNISPSGTINFFDAATAGNPVSDGANFRGGQLGSGLTIFAEGASASGAMNDVTLTLTLTPGTKPVKPPATATMTSVRVTLDICTTRSSAGSDPPVLPDDKITVGRFLHVQDTGNRHRAMLIAHQAEPAAFTGNLVLTPIGGAQAFDQEGPTTGSPVTTPFAAPADQKFWVQGTTVSGALRDTGFKLGVDGVDPDGDRVAITVFKITQIEAKLRATPCKRDGSRADAMASRTSTTDDKNFATSPITLVKDCGDLKLTATATPDATTISWMVERAADDAGLTGLPTDSADGSDKKHIVKADGTGSFHVHAFVDVNGDGKRGSDEDGLILNLNMVKVEIIPGAANNRIIKHNDFNNTASNSAVLIVDSGLPGASQGINGVYADSFMDLRPAAMRVVVKLTGGGAHQRRGTDVVFLGYIHNFTGDNFTGTYADGRALKEVFTQDPAASDPITSGVPPLLGFPIRDTRATNQNSTGPFIINSTDREITNLAAGGQQRIVKFMDRPRIGLNMTHPVTGSALASISGSNDFVAFMCGFSSDYDENYTVFAKGEWKITFGTFSAATGWSKTGAAVAAAAAMDNSGMPQTGENAGVERCTPNAVDNLKMDAR